MPTAEEIIGESLPPKYQGNPFLPPLAGELQTASEQGANWDRYTRILVRHLTSIGMTEPFAKEVSRRVIPQLEGHGFITVSGA